MTMKMVDHFRAYLRLKDGRLMRLIDLADWADVEETGSVVTSTSALTKGGIITVKQDGTAVVTLGRRGTKAPPLSLERAEAQAWLLDKNGTFLRVSQDPTLAAG